MQNSGIVATSPITSSITSQLFNIASFDGRKIMRSESWQLQDAKNQFSKVVAAALHGEPQHVTRRGREAVVIISADEYLCLEKLKTAAMPSFVDHLLALPKDDVKFERLPFNSREVEF